MDAQKRRRGRPATGRSVESLEAHKLNRAIWNGSRSRVWLTKRVHRTWKIYKGMSLFNTDNDFAAHLLSLEMARLQRLNREGTQAVRLRKGSTTKQLKRKTAASSSVPVTSTPSQNRKRQCLFSPEMSPCVVGDSQCDISISESNQSSSFVDVTGSFVDNAGDGTGGGTGGNCDEDGETRKTFADTEDENESYQILNGSVILTPGKNFQSDSSDDDSESNIIDEETDNNDKEELNVTSLQNFLSLLEDHSDSDASGSSSSSESSGGESDVEDENVDSEDYDLGDEELQEIVSESDAEDCSEEHEAEPLFCEYPIGPGWQFSRAEEIHEHTEELIKITDRKFLASESKIIELFKGRCQEPGCCGKCKVKSKTVGCTQEIWWTCTNGHKGKWSSSEKYSRMYANNLQFSAAVLLSGNNFAKVELMSRFLGLACPSKASFFRVQKFYCVPAIDEWWQWLRSNIVSLIGNLEVIVSGDGQSDSPGHSAKYLTYFVMVTNAMQDYIIHLECLDKREVGGKSPCMEKEALKRAIVKLKDIVNLKEVVTDASSSIIKMMADEFKDIVHSLDIWHKSKNIRKCLIQIGKTKGNEKIALWTDHIINHFWFCCANCDGQESKLKTLWISLLHHVCNQHEWIDGSCAHEPIPDDSEHSLPWFDRRDKDFQALQEVILNPRLLASLKYYVKFRHTGLLETVNSHSLMYATKRCAFQYKGFKARKTLCAIDHNYHLHRKPQSNESGENMYSRKYNQRSKHWDAVALKEDKDYSYIPMLMAKIFKMRQNDCGCMQDFMEMSLNDPRRIAPTIAPTIPLPTSELVSRHRSRFLSRQNVNDSDA